MICTNCSAEIRDGVRFCPKCGARTSEPVAGIPRPIAPVGFQPPEVRPEPIPAPEPRHREFVLQPLGFGQLFDVAIKMYIKHFKPIIMIEVLPMLPLTIYSVLVPLLLKPMMTKGGMGIFGVLSFLVWIVTMLVMVLQGGAMTKLISDIYLGEPYSVRRAFSAAFSRSVRIFLFYICVMVLVMIGFILLLIPGIYLSVAFMIGPSIIMLEQGGVSQTIDRCFKLVKGFWFRLAFAMFICMAGTTIVSLLFSGLARILGGGFPGQGGAVSTIHVVISLIGGVLSMFLYPVPAILVVLFYYDLRVRKEGFDLEVMAHEIA